jgi:hypothetical protein
MGAWAGVKTEAALRQLVAPEVELSQRSQRVIARCRSGDDVCDVSKGCATPLGKTDAE